MHQQIRGQILATVTDAQRRHAVDRGGTVPPAETEPYEARLRDPAHADEATWYAYAPTFTQFRARVRTAFLPSIYRDYADQPLLAFVVEPLEDIPTTRPPSEQPWHISIDFYGGSAARRGMLRRLHQRYAEGRVVTLRGQLHGLAFYLDGNSDLMGDDLFRHIHATGGYSGREPHVSL